MILPLIHSTAFHKLYQDPCDCSSPSLVSQLSTALTSASNRGREKVPEPKLRSSTPTSTVMTFIETPEFKRNFIGYVHPATLLVLRRACKPWQRVAESHITKLMKQGVLELHQGTDTDKEVADSDARKEKMERVTQAIFLQNVTQIGERACKFAVNLVVVDIPEGIDSITKGAPLNTAPA